VAGDGSDDIEALARGVLARDRASVARALSLVDDQRAASRPAQGRLLAALLRGIGSRETSIDRGHRVGVTGPPGVGKSTLVGAVARVLRDRGRTVGILAVDPSSLRSGGALLGDRARMTFDPADDGVFVRSLATAGDRGGLGAAAHPSARVLAAAYEVVLVETTGVGQSETDIEDAVDSVVLVVQPGAGDTLQFVKAGIMEIGDVIVVNKADQAELARRAVADLESAAHAADAVGATRGETWRRPILATSARDGTGVDELVDALDRHRLALGRDGIVARRGRCDVAWALGLVTRRFGAAGVEAGGGLRAVRARIERALEEGQSPPSAAEDVGRELLRRLRQR
jgi:LAO/AO transport system kinase